MNTKKIILSVALFSANAGWVAGMPFRYVGPSQEDVDTSTPTYVGMEVKETGVIADLTLSVDLHPPYPDGVDISLIHDGKEVLVYDGQGGTWHSNIEAVFDDHAPTNYPVDGTVEGTFKPKPGQLDTFKGSPLNGLWQLKLQDTIGPNDGTVLGSWSIQGNTRAPIKEKKK